MSATPSIDSSVFDHHDDGAMLLHLECGEDRSDRIVCSYANSAARSLLGVEADAAAAAVVAGLLPAELDNIVRCLRQVIDGGLPCQLAITPRDASLPLAEMRALRNGPGNGVLAFLRPGEGAVAHAGTVMPHASPSAGEAVSQLAELIAHLPLAVALLDGDANITSLNARALHLFGWNGAEPPGRLLDIEPPVQISTHALWKRVMASGAATQGELIAAAGERRWWANCFPIRHASGALLGAGLVAREAGEPGVSAEILHYVENRFHAFMNNCPAAAYIKDREGRIVWVNAYLERHYKRPAEQWLGRTEADFLPAEEAALIQANDMAVLEGGETMSFFETTSHGERKDHFLSFKFPIRDSSGNQTLLGGMSVNVNKQIETQEEIRRLNDALRLRENELQALLDLVPMAIYTAHDPDCASISVNRAAMELVSGDKPGEFWTRLADQGALGTLRVFKAGKALNADEFPIRHAAQGGEIRGDEYELLLADGSRKHVFCYASPLHDVKGTIRGGITAFLDVSEPIRARQRLETMFRSNLIGNICWTLGGSITSANDVFLASVGYSREDLQAGQLSWRSLTPPEYDELDRAKLGELAQNRFHTPYEKEYLHKDGHRIPVLVSTAFFPDSADEGISYIVDLSEVKRTGQRINELLTQVTAASNAKDNFLATLAHELRNPLAPIRNSVHSLKLKGIEDPQVVWMLEIIERQVSHMARMLEDLLDVARIARDKLSLRTEVLDLSSIMETAVETSRPLIDARRHRLLIEIPPRPLLLEADPVRLAQVFANILNNAAKYTPEGGTIHVSAVVSNDDIVIDIRDNGIGIAPDVLPRVFDLFAQAEPALEHAQGGLGIGLSLVRGLVELHGGTVTARSEGKGRGSAFSVRLPLLTTSRAAADPNPVQAVHRLPYRVLVVDDNTDSADSLATVLMLSGCTVTSAYNGADALRQAEEFRPDVVLLDVDMRPMSGHEVCHRVRQTMWGRSTYVIAMTGWGQDEDRVRTREAGFDMHLVKPVDVAALIALLEARALSTRLP